MEGLTALGVERSQQLVSQAVGDRAQANENAPALGRQADDVPAPVARVPLALDEAALLEGVQDPDKLAAVELERVGDRGLSLPGLFTEEGENAVVVEAEPGLLDFRDRLGLEAVAHTGEQEGGVCDQLLGEPGRRRSGELSYLSGHGN